MTASKYVPRGVSPLPWSEEHGQVFDANGSIVADIGIDGRIDARYIVAASTLGPLADALETALGAVATLSAKRTDTDRWEPDYHAARTLLDGLARAVAEIDGGAQ